MNGGRRVAGEAVKSSSDRERHDIHRLHGIAVISIESFYHSSTERDT